MYRLKTPEELLATGWTHQGHYWILNNEILAIPDRMIETLKDAEFPDNVHREVRISVGLMWTVRPEMLIKVQTYDFVF